jgi:hypothetical protein
MVNFLLILQHGKPKPDDLTTYTWSSLLYTSRSHKVLPTSTEIAEVVHAVMAEAGTPKEDGAVEPKEDFPQSQQ